MATHMEAVQTFLTQMGLPHHLASDHEVALEYRTQVYRNPEGEDSLVLVVRLDEDGRYIRIFSPQAFRAVGPHVGAFFHACLKIQWFTKLIQYEFDDTDAEIRTMVEFPIEDACLTFSQLKRCLDGMVTLHEDYYPALQRALDEGIVDLPERSLLPLPASAKILAGQLLAVLRQSNQVEPNPMVDQLVVMLKEFREPPEDLCSTDSLDASL